MSHEAVFDDTLESVSEGRGSTTTAADASATAQAVIGVFDYHAEAERAIRTLDEAGFPLRQLSIVGKGYHTEEIPTGFYGLGDRLRLWTGAGLFWGGLWGLLFGAAFVWEPGLGPMAIAEPLLGLLLSGLEGAAVVGAVSALVALLVSYRQPKKEAFKYEREVKAERFLVVARGTGR